MPVSVVTVEIHLPGARSLKEKRRIVKSLKDRIHGRFRVSIAETALHELHQRSELGIAAVAPDGAHLRRLGEQLRRLFDERYDIVVTRWDERLVEDGG
ncbi:MAG: DUF503 domain-containing protein [Acidobacteriota bacterium]|nr:DUF503 domain-containing protein [Acidobacteriota bacterium]MDH3523394.1 DUF503 domain-containing protein [Acidobacteriota bacterium]